MSLMSNETSPPWIIAVHGGAGYHSKNPKNEKLVKHALRAACNASLRTSKLEKFNSIDAVELAICALEDDPCLNAGTGSNLTYDGSVECDASIVDGEDQKFGSVGALRGVKNPIKTSRLIMENSKIRQPLGRVPPLTLVGAGASEFSRSHGMELVDPREMITENSLRDWKLWKSRLDNADDDSSHADSIDSDKKDLPKEGYGRGVEDDNSVLEDTVGAVSCDCKGMMAAGVSSGGILLKYPGRIGEAAVYGAGAWACSPRGSHSGIACSISGTGEAIIRSALAHSLIKALEGAPPEEAHDVLHEQIQRFCDEQYTQYDSPSVGIILVRKDPLDFDDDEVTTDSDTSNSSFEIDDSEKDTKNSAGSFGSSNKSQGYKLRLWCAFTTDSMAIGYTSSYAKDKVKTLILRQSTRENVTSQPLDPDSGQLDDKTRRKNQAHICIVALPLNL
ncbi:N-terminal nucleophile aminohydrolase [Pyrrhoderma noxium]|uniref:N-terminal nucleophile aminohydrolase n=1 Tax=Pyrrhoderma noxium TaxID=2282107 RepID=A0A286UGV8_9AGAM|nr:N-terminal nucleophile aminohydrolase [Pyrrhoderma noxium]